MKKLLAILAMVALTGVLTVSAAESRLENYVNKKLSPLTTKEKEFNAKMEAQQKENAAKKAKYTGGKAVSPMRLPAEVKVSRVKSTVPSKVTSMTGREGRLCSRGTFWVRRRCRIRIWVHMDSKNHPV